MLGIVSDEEFEEVLKDVPSSQLGEVREINRGRGDKANTPDVIREVIAEEGVKGESNKELAKLFGVSESSVSAYKVGATSCATYNDPNKDLVKTVKRTKLNIRNKASKKLKYAIDAMTEDEIASATVMEKATIARQMAAIFKDMDEPEVEDSKGVQVVIFAPKMRGLEDYEVVEGQVLTEPNS